MPNLAVLNDQATGNNQGGFVFKAASGVLSDNIPVARLNDDVLVWGLTNIAPTGVREVFNFPTIITPSGPIQWFIMEYGSITSGSGTTKGSSEGDQLPLAFQGSTWQSSHFFGTIQATSRHDAK